MDEPVQAPPPAEGKPGGGPKPKNYRVRLLSAVNSMPPLPQALRRLLGMLRSDSFSVSHIAEVIEGDSVLSGSVLRCVNSAYYGIPRRVSSIRHAVTLLGFHSVRNLAFAFSMRRMMTGSAASRKLYSTYSRHALATALMTQEAASATHTFDTETAFAAGLFHDVGKLLIYTAAPEAVPEILAAWNESGSSYEEAEQTVIETTHSELSAIVLEGWKLPQAICGAARYHHNLDDDPSAEPGALSLAALVQAADLIVNLEGLRTPESNREIGIDPAEALTRLGFTQNPKSLLEKFRAEFEHLQEMFH